MADDFLCVRCARVQRTCCQFSEVYVSPGDVRRIVAFTGQTDFCEDRKPDNPAYADQDDDPVWRDNVFQADGTRRVMRRLEDGSCTFLGEAGCRLPLETRPLVCRLYPFDYDHEGIKEELASGCPVHLIREGQTLLSELDMKVQDARRWQAQLYCEIRQEGEFRSSDQCVGDPSSALADVNAS